MKKILSYTLLLFTILSCVSTGNKESNTIKEGNLRINYSRVDGKYSGWGLHVYGEGYNGEDISWEKPLKKSGKNENGIFWDIPYSNNGDLKFIIHNGDNKEGDERTFYEPLINRQIWIVSDRSEIFVIPTNSETNINRMLIKNNEIKQRSQALEIIDSKFYIDIDDTTIKLLFESKPTDLVNFYLGNSEDSLKKVESVINPGKKGVVVTDLVPGENYYYQIEAIRGDRSIKTDIIEFNKIGRTNDWSPAEWARTSVFYEIFVRSFSDGNGDGIGDFIGLKNRIPYLKELGVDALWLMPINDSPSYHGYDVVDYYAVEPDYGTLEDFKALLDEAHKNDIKIIIDLVLNHSSSKNSWFLDSKSSLNSKYRDYYDWSDSTDKLTENGPFGSKMWISSNTGYYNAIFWSEMPDFNLRNVEVRDELKNIASFWLDVGVDGFRLDAALHIDSKDSDVSHNWWQEFNTFVKDQNPDALLVGENWTSTNKMAGFFEDLDSSFNFSFANNILQMAGGRNVDLLKTLSGIHKAYSKYNTSFIDSTFLTNHDQERVASTLSGDVNKIKLAASILLTMPGTPFLYYGEELGQLGQKPDENLREPLDWYKTGTGTGMTTMDKGGFNNPMKYTLPNDGISYEEQSGVTGSMLEYYKKLISIRKENAEFSKDENYTTLDLPKGLYGYKVETKEKNIFVIHNFSKNIHEINTTSNAVELLTDRIIKSGEVLILNPGNSILLETISELF